jgi:pyruvate dehydrogenase E1 component alpha subunit
MHLATNPEERPMPAAKQPAAKKPAARTAKKPAANAEGLELLGRMLRIRCFEDEIQRMFTQGLVRGTTHLCQGQEAVSVGVTSALKPGDTMTCTYRGHGAVLAMGAPPDATFGEIMGKAGGLCGGKGGSMHLTDVKVGAYGSFAIVGAHLPITVGLAFASRFLGDDNVSVCFFGDGTTNIGAFHEALNLASLWKTPSIFVCENNLYGEYSPLASTTPISRLADRAASYAMPGVVVDGNDVFAVQATAAQAVARARAGEGPTLIEALTYRQVGHSRSDPAKYRPEGELDAWLQRDPIVLLQQKLIEGGVSAAEVEQLREASEQTILDALDRAKSWPDPTLESRFENVLV